MNKHRRHSLLPAAALFVLSALCPADAEEQSRTSSVTVTPGIDVPLGEYADYYGLGATLKLQGRVHPGSFPVYPLFGMDYAYLPSQADASVSLLTGWLGAGSRLQLGPRLSGRAAAGAGFYYGFLNGGSVSDTGPAYEGSLAVDFLVNPRIDLSLGVSYKGYPGLYTGINAVFGTAVHVGDTGEREQRLEESRNARRQQLPDLLKPGPGRGLQLVSVNYDDVFPVFHKHYDDHPVGVAVIENMESEAITEVKIQLLIKQYMDSPKLCVVLPKLEAGARADVDLYALFSDRILEVTEGTKVPADLQVEYLMDGRQYGEVRTETVRLLDRNAMTWDDDRRAAAFVTAKDPAVLGFSKTISGLISDKGLKAVSTALQTAIAVHEGLRLYGLSYVTDPQTPYVELAKTSNRVDYLQFPRQTLQYRAGDCDDISILYAALLESVGIETAFITVPGHIFMAFVAESDPEAAARAYLNQQDLIFLKDRAWVPVEVTERDGFLTAWQAGAKLWREAAAENSAQFYPIHEAWASYEPVGLPGAAGAMALPGRERIENAYFGELMRFIDREIYPRVQQLEAQLTANKGDIKVRNRLGVLYARYGVYDKAKAEFEQVLTSGEYAPSLCNLGNISFLEEEYMKALTYYQRANAVDPGNAGVLLGLSRVHYELENYTMSRLAHQELAGIDSSLAEKYVFLRVEGDGGERAAQSGGLKGEVLWDE
jgi:tetratricopeptide (TPR) repeat protein